MTVSKQTLPELCAEIAAYAYREVSDAVSQFVRDLASAQKELPDAFDMSSDGWLEAERRIDAACGAQDLDALLAACSEYRQRAARFLTGWRKNLGMPEPEQPRVRGYRAALGVEVAA